MASQSKVSRRDFIAKSALFAGLPYIIPSGVLAQPGRPGANDRISIGHIGVGGMGSGHVHADAVALCDVDQGHLADVAKRVQGKPFLCTDYRRLLERKDVDAVMIATPDHWHALQMVHACQAGKDVYTEKPTCRTIEEGQAMINAARRYGRVVQVGAQGRSTSAGHAACTYIRNGQLGKVSRVEVWHPESMGEGSWGQEGPAPASLDWNLWLGPMRWREYNPSICHFNFRWLMDSGGGFIRDRGNHALNIVFWCLNLDGKGPVSVKATAEPYEDAVYDAPKRLHATWTFRDPDLTVTWDQPGKSYNGIEWGERFVGSRDTLIVAGGDGGCDTEQKAKDFRVTAGGVEVPRSTDHRQNWLDCIRSRRKPIADIEALVSVVTLPITALIAARLGRELQFDPAAHRFVGDEEANRLLSEPYRAPWRLDGV
ncbi:MAG TPA: Gfo/Idh/MocA family oxidoreductase [Armatimonadota bacterium]